jgi:integrase
LATYGDIDMGSVKKRGERQYQAIIRLKGYPAKTKTHNSEKEAKDWIRLTEAKMTAGVFVDMVKEMQEPFDCILFRYLHEVTASHKGAESEGYRICRMRKQDLAQYKISAVTPAVLRAYRDLRLTEVAPGSVRRDLELLRAIFNYAAREWELPIVNPVSAIKLPEKSQARNRRISKTEEDWILKGLEDTERNPDGTFSRGARNPWLKPALQISIETAMRRSELLRLEWKHVDLAIPSAYLPTTKNNHPRAVPLSTAAVAILVSLPKSESGKVFPTTDAALKKGFERALTRARYFYLEECAKTGAAPKEGFLIDFRWHDARHEATSRMATKLPNIIELGSVTGHRDVRMLQRYYHPDVAELARKLG